MTADKASLRRRVVALSRSIAIVAAIGLIGYAAADLIGPRQNAAASSFAHRIDRLTALCGSTTGSRLCRRWRSG